jgi:hypothetical protein
MLRLVPLILVLGAAPSLLLAQKHEPSTSHTAPVGVATLVDKGSYMNREGFDVHRPAHTANGAFRRVQLHSVGTGHSASA